MEVKIGDPSANPYFASAVVLGLALDGIEQRTPLPPEIAVDPATLDDVVTLPTDQATVIAALDGSSPHPRHPR